MNNVGTSYILWALGFLGFAGLHRFYNRKYFTGFLWLITGGFFFVGQFIDLFLIPGMVNEHNAWVMFRRTFRPQTSNEVADSTFATQPPSSATRQATTAASSGSPPEDSNRPDRLMIQLLRTAENHDGRLTVTQGVMDTGYSFSEVESTLREMVKTGYIVAHNDPVSGVLVFDFIELSDPPAPKQPFEKPSVPHYSYSDSSYSDSANRVI